MLGKKDTSTGLYCDVGQDSQVAWGDPLAPRGKILPAG